MFQVEKFTKTQAFHENINCKDAAEILAGHMENFRQMQIETVQAEYTVLVSKKGKISIKRKNRKSAAPPAELSHDRKKGRSFGRKRISFARSTVFLNL